MMYAEILVRYLHFVGIIVLVAAVLGQQFLLKPELTRREVARLSVLDRFYAVSVVIVLGAGFLLWFGVGKAAPFYSQNPLMHVKLTLFLLVGLISIYPTLFFNRQRKGPGDEKIRVPGGLLWSVRAELLLLAVMPLLASLMARGVGLK